MYEDAHNGIIEAKDDSKPIFVFDEFDMSYYILLDGIQYFINEKDVKRIIDSNDDERLAIEWNIINKWISGRYEI